MPVGLGNNKKQETKTPRGEKEANRTLEIFKC